VNKPYIIFGRTGTTPTQTKDGRINKVQLTFDIYSSEYAQGVDIAVRVDEALRGEHTTERGNFGCYTEIFSESCSEDDFVQTITFNNILR
jgi:hypothetical protein